MFCLNPGKLVKIIGSILTPSLLILIIVMFVTFLFKIDKSIASPKEIYSEMFFLQGVVDGYQTMDAIAALNFGLVIALTLKETLYLELDFRSTSGKIFPDKLLVNYKFLKW